MIAFTYVERCPTSAAAPAATEPDADKICDAATIGPGDGIPEIIVGSRALQVNAANGATPAVNADRPIGRGYVIDGKTRAVLKRIDMPPADRAAQAALGTSPQFARVMASPQALPPCAGSVAENNNQGVGPCPAMPRVSRIGDLDGGGQPDIVITARNYVETSQEPDTVRRGPAHCHERHLGGGPRIAVSERDHHRGPDAGQLHLRQGVGLQGRGHRRHQPAGDPRHRDLLDQEPACPDRRSGVRRQPLPARDITPTSRSRLTVTRRPRRPRAPRSSSSRPHLSYPFSSPTSEFVGVGAAFMINGRTAR